MTTAGPRCRNKSSNPTFARRMMGEALTTQSETTRCLLLEFFEVYGKERHLGPSGCFQEFAVSHPRQSGRLARGQFAPTAQKKCRHTPQRLARCTAIVLHLYQHIVGHL